MHVVLIFPSVGRVVGARVLVIRVGYSAVVTVEHPLHEG